MPPRIYTREEVDAHTAKIVDVQRKLLKEGFMAGFKVEHGVGFADDLDETLGDGWQELADSRFGQFLKQREQ